MCVPPEEACTALRTRGEADTCVCRLQKRERREARAPQKRERREALPEQDGGDEEADTCVSRSVCRS